MTPLLEKLNPYQLRRARSPRLSRHRPPTGRRKAPPDDRLQRTIQYARDGRVHSISRGVLDTRIRGYDGRCAGGHSRQRTIARDPGPAFAGTTCGEAVAQLSYGPVI